MGETVITKVVWECEECGKVGDGWETMREHYDGHKS